MSPREYIANLWLTERLGYPPFLADFECHHGNLSTDKPARCECWKHMTKEGTNA